MFQVVNKPDSHGGCLDWTKICERSSKVITFIDLAGHEKYLKTTVFGMTGHMPDFCMLMVRPGLVCVHYISIPSVPPVGSRAVLGIGGRLSVQALGGADAIARISG